MGNSKRVARRGTAAKRLPGTRLLMSMFPEVREHTKLKKKTGPLASSQRALPARVCPRRAPRCNTKLVFQKHHHLIQQSRAEEGRRLDEWSGSAA